MSRLDLVNKVMQNDWVLALSIILLSVLLARLTAWIFNRVLHRLARRTRWAMDDKILAILPPPVYATILAVGIHIALLPVGLSAGTQRLLNGVFGTVIILAWSWAISGMCRLVFEKMSRIKDGFEMVQKSTVSLFDNLAKIIIVGAAAYLLLRVWEIDVTPWIASAGILGLALGLAAKDTLANLFAGIFILADKPYKIGEYVVLESGERGVVTQIGLRSTRLLTRDDVQVIVPNAQIAAAKVLNESGGRHVKMRVRVKVEVAYGSKVDEVREALLEAVVRCGKIVADRPEPRVRFRYFGNSGLGFELLCWVNLPVQRGRALDALNTAVYEILGERGIEIPFPKQDVYIRSMPPLEGAGGKP